LPADGPAVTGWLRLKRRALLLAQPLSANLELTYRCNWRCVFCYNPRHHDQRGLTTAEWLAVLDDLRALGTLSVALTGGEALVHPGFLDIARGVRERSLALRVFTNGSLVDDAMADALAGLEPMAVELSLHGATALTHDRTTGRAGSFKALLDGVARLQRRGLPLLVKTPVTRLNEHELEAIVELADRLGVPHKLDATLTPRDDGSPAPLEYRASPAAVERTYRLVAERGRLPHVDREPGMVNCGLGRITLAVDPEGNVYPCLQWKSTSLGNVRRTPLRELWRDSLERLEAARVAVAANDAMRERGGALSSFPFCPALALQSTGDPLRPDPFHVEQAETVARLRPRLA
jgi:MoaA/NifB/PqqE/SkfB family radical SAM enzyme